MRSTTGIGGLGVALALGSAAPGVGLAQSSRNLVPFIGAGGSAALISYGTIQDVSQSKSNWGFGAEAGLSWWIGQRIAVRGAVAAARHGRAQVPSCTSFLEPCPGPITFTSKPGADLVTGSVDLQVAPRGVRSRLVGIAGVAVGRQSGAFVLGDRTALGIRAGAGIYPFTQRARGLGLELLATRYFTAHGGIRWAFGAGMKFGF